MSNLMGQIWIGECSFSSSINLNYKPNPNTTEQYIIATLILLLAFITTTLLLNYINNHIIYQFSTFSLNFNPFFFLLIYQLIIILSQTFSLPFTFSCMQTLSTTVLRGLHLHHWKPGKSNSKVVLILLYCLLVSGNFLLVKNNKTIYIYINSLKFWEHDITHIGQWWLQIEYNGGKENT